MEFYEVGQYFEERMGLRPGTAKQSSCPKSVNCWFVQNPQAIKEIAGM